ncbi:MAG: DUF3140 domain-containing protein [Leeuwenhoekiella sp.]
MFARERLYKELHQAINMSPAELRAWLRTDIAPITVANYSDAPSLEQSRKFLKLISLSVEELTTADCQLIQTMLHRLNYVKRCRNKVSDVRADWSNSLRNMGYDIRKESILKKESSYL